MKQSRPLAITGGQIVTPDGVVKGAVRLADGLIVDAGAGVTPQDGDALLDAKGKLVAPGIVDFGVFKVDKPAFHFGGITRAALMPDQSPPLDYPSRVNYIAKSGKPDLWVHPLAAATRALHGSELAEIALMREAGARGVATGRRWIADSGVMLRLMQYAAMLDLVVVCHAEDDGLAAGAAATSGEIATRLGLPSAPAEAETLALARDIALAEMSGARVHFRGHHRCRVRADPRGQGQGDQGNLRDHPCAFHAVRSRHCRFPHLHPAFTALAQRGGQAGCARGDSRRDGGRDR